MLCPFFGVPPGVYRLHHCVMHHVEGNAPGDMTSTQRFQRDSALHFVLYVAAMLASILLLPVYALTRARRVDLAARSAVAILAYASAMRGLHARAPIASGTTTGHLEWYSLRRYPVDMCTVAKRAQENCLR